jgi:hypothetical protein
MPSRSSAAGPARSLTTDRGRYLWETLRELWPEPARIVRAGRFTAAPAGSLDFLVVPSESRAALVLPRRPRRATATALRHYKASAAGPRRLVFSGLAAAARSGLGDALPHRIVIERDPGPSGRDLIGYLTGALHQEVLVSVRIGTPRANRKPVLELLTPAGAALGFAKVGVSTLTRELVRAEASALTVLNSVPLTNVRVPRLIHHGQWRDHEVLVEETFSGPGEAPRLADLNRAMSEVTEAGETARLPLDRSPYWRDLRSRLINCPHRALGAELLRALDDLGALASQWTIGFGSWHGDWTPWNMAMVGGCAMVWDWERFRGGVPVGFDAVHYRLQSAVVSNGQAPRDAAEAAVRLAPETLAYFALEPVPAQLVAVLYLLEIAARYLHDGQAEAGARLGDVGRWLLPAVSHHVSRLRAQSGPHALETRS